MKKLLKLFCVAGVVVCAGLSQAATLNWFNGTTNKAYNTDGTTPLYFNTTTGSNSATGGLKTNESCFVQLIWCGPDDVINTATRTGNVTGVSGDDVVVMTACIGFASKATGVKTTSSYNTTPDGTHYYYYVRVWNAPSTNLSTGVQNIFNVNAASPKASTVRYGDSARYAWTTVAAPQSFSFGGTSGSLRTSLNPTLIVLIGLDSFINDAGAVVIRWATASETKTVGFNLYRKDGEVWVKVNAALIPAKGVDGGGATYEVVDAAAVKGGVYSYKLEEVETTGGSQWYPSETGVALTAGNVTITGLVTIMPDGNVQLKWLSRVQDKYRVIRTTAMNNPAWQVIAADIAPDASGVNTYIDTDAKTIPNAFYRIEAAQ